MTTEGKIWKWNEESKKNKIPWNKGLKGRIHDKQFKKGHIPWIKGKKWSKESKQKMREVRKRWWEKQERKDNKYRYMVYNEKFIKRSHYNYCIANGLTPIPYGCCIHHKDLNKSNDNPDNLILLTNEYHSWAHRIYENKIKGEKP